MSQLEIRKLENLIEKNEAQLTKNNYRTNSNKKGLNLTEQLLKNLYRKLEKLEN